jgi:hypothetical protein
MKQRAEIETAEMELDGFSEPNRLRNPPTRFFMRGVCEIPNPTSRS